MLVIAVVQAHVIVAVCIRRASHAVLGRRSEVLVLLLELVHVLVLALRMENAQLQHNRGGGSDGGRCSQSFRRLISMKAESR